ncbi:MAG: hypothetical protein VX000_11945, partial [Myxococcota bacterium]|nr:hypothetical protein [Myxococcota bacterium]
MNRLLAILLAGCGPRQVPPHLRPEPTAAAVAPAADPPPATLGDAATQLVAGDPLVRRAQPRESGHWHAVPAPSGLPEWATVARNPNASPAAWYAVEQRSPGTLAVPLARGGRLAALEVVLASTRNDAALALPWLGPVVRDGAPLPAASRAPLAWLAGPAENAAERALRVAERSVLLGWLDAPDLPITAAVAAFRPGIHDRLTTSPPGALLVARAEDRRSPERGERGQHALAMATRLALLGAAADRDAEQARHADMLATHRTDEDDLDPIGRLLTSAAADLTANAGDDRSTGLALVALTASRLRGSCRDLPCTGLDRMQTLAAADRWSAGASAAVWRVIALKSVLDRLDVARDRPSFPSAVVDLADVLLGLGASTVPERLIRARRPDAAVWLAVSRAADGGDGTAWEDARAALAA